MSRRRPNPGDPLERRKHQRVPCRIPCEIQRENDKKKVSGAVHNISEGGLGVRADIAVAEEEILTLFLKTGPKTVVVKCMVWHVRKVRRASTGQRFSQLGLVLVQPSDEFFQLAAQLGSKTGAKQDTMSRPPTTSAKVPATPKAAEHPSGGVAIPNRPAVSVRAPPPRVVSPSRSRAESPRSRTASGDIGVPRSFALQVKQDGGPRTRRLVVGAQNPTDAKEKALAEIGTGWTVLEIKPA